MKIRKTLRNIVAASWLAGASLFAPPAEAKESDTPNQSQVHVQHEATLPRKLGEIAEKHILEQIALYIKEHNFPGNPLQRDFKQMFESVTNPQDKNKAVKAAYGIITATHAGQQQSSCAVYLYYDDNKNGTFDGGAGVRKDAKEEGFVVIPGNTFLGEKNSPFLNACSLFVAPYKAMLEYKLLDLPHDIKGKSEDTDFRRSYPFITQKYTKTERDKAQECVLDETAKGIKRNEGHISVHAENTFEKIFWSLDNPKISEEYDVEILEQVGSSSTNYYTLVFRDKNKNTIRDPGEKVVHIIRGNDSVGYFLGGCAEESQKAAIERVQKLIAEDDEPFVPFGTEEKQKSTEKKAKEIEPKKTRRKSKYGLIQFLLPTYFFSSSSDADVTQLNGLARLTTRGTRWYLDVELEGRVETTEDLQNNVYTSESRGSQQRSFFDNNDEATILMAGLTARAGLVTEHFLPYAILGVRGHNLNAEGRADNKLGVLSQSAMRAGFGTVVQLFDDHLALRLEGGYDLGMDMSGIYSAPLDEDEDGIVTAERFESEFKLPGMKAPMLKFSASAMSDKGVFARIYAESEGANVKPLCDLISCEGAYGRIAKGISLGYLSQFNNWGAKGTLGDWAIGVAATVKQESSGWVKIFDYNNAIFIGGTLMVGPLKSNDNGLAVPEVR